MTESSNPSAFPAQQRVDAFLSAVERSLAEARVPEDERRSVLEDLRAQILDMLAGRAGSIEKANEGDVEAVLSQLDPPESYRESGEPAMAGAAASDERVGEPKTHRGGHHGSRRGRACGHWGHRGWHRAGIGAAIRGAVKRMVAFHHPIVARFTPRALEAMALAKAEARRWNHGYIGTEHVLLGLVSQESLAGQILAGMKIDAKRVRDAVERLMRPGEAPVYAERLPLTPRVLRAMQSAALESEELGADWVGTEHLLLGLLSEPEGVAGIALRELGVSAAAARDAIRSAYQQKRTAAPFTFWPAGTGKTVTIAGETYTIIAGGGETGGSHAILDVRVAPGAPGLPARSVAGADLAAYVLEGQLRFAVGDRAIDVTAGGFLNIPRAVVHSFRNASDAPARAMVIATPGGFEKFIAEIAASLGEVAASAVDAAMLADTAAKHGVHINSNVSN